MPEMTPIGVLKEFFKDKPLSLQEIKALSPEERLQLAKEAAEILGVTVKA